MTKRTVLKAVLTIVLLLPFTILGFFWNEARKEVVYLCGNFQAGDTEQNVMRQLGTANLLRIEISTKAGMKLVAADSVLNLGGYRCEILLSPEGIVAEVESP